MAGLALMILFTSGLQILPRLLQPDKELNDEMKRRRDTCDSIERVDDRIKEIEKLNEQLEDAEEDLADLAQEISDIQESADAGTKQLAYLKLKFLRNFSIRVISYIFIIVIFSYIIIRKRAARG